MDVRNLEGEGILAALEGFYNEATLYDTNENNSKAKGLLSMMMKIVKQFTVKLNSQWNVGLPRADADRVPDPGEGSSSSASTRRGEGDIDKPTWKSGTQEFYRVEYEKKEYSCDDCNKVFSNAQSYKRHSKASHNKAVKPEEPKILCRLPHTKKGTRVVDRHTADQLNSHLCAVSFSTI